MRILYLIAILFFTLSSCTKWLDVTPKDIIIEKDAFKDGEGYRNALNGIYRGMSTESMYGQEMSWGFADVLGQCYKSDGSAMPVGSTYQRIGNQGTFDSDDVKSIISGIWSDTYNVIANCNNLIENAKTENVKKFRGGELERNMILGEAMAVRGLLHFDMLRLFVKAPIKGVDDPAIPYFTKFKSKFESKKTTKEILNLVIEDLIAARDLVSNFDTLTIDNIDRKVWMARQNRFSEKWGHTNHMPLDAFYGFRGYRMNYLAIGAILARVYNYAGHYDLASIEANKVISFIAGSDQRVAIAFTPVATVAGDRKLSSEIIFSLAEKQIYDIFSRYTNFDKNRIELVLNGSLDNLFDDKADYRRTDLVTANKSKSNYIPNKHILPTVTNNNSEMVADMLPVIRLSEMYYILAETYASKNDFNNAKIALDNVRIARNCKSGLLKITDTNSFNTELIKEVKRDLICEGQAFFYYKKLNILPRTSYSESTFVIPLPENEEIN